MAKNSKIVVAEHEPGHGSLGSYIVGFALSVYLTLFAYLVVTHHVWGNHVLFWTIAFLALVQFFVQAFFFLHLGRESKPRWKVWVFGGMIVVVLILVFGSIWIMNNLNYHMMTPAEEKLYLHNNEGL